MAEPVRLNAAIRALEQGQPAFTTFTPPEIGVAQAINTAPYDAVVFEMDEILAICKQYNVACGHPHVDSTNVDALLEKGFRWLMTAPGYSFAGLEKGLETSGRTTCS